MPPRKQIALSETTWQTPIMSFRVVIDGSNLLKPNDSLNWSLDYLTSAIEEVRRAAKSANSARQLQLKVFVDASSYYKLTGEEQSEFEVLERRGEIERTPSRSEADPYIIEWAARNNGLIVSNDGYRQFESQHPWLKTSGRTAGAVYDAVTDSWSIVERNYGRNTPRRLIELLQSQSESGDKVKPVTSGVPSTPAATTAATTPPSPPPPPPPAKPKVTKSYETPITRQHPALMVLLLDQSGSMQNAWWQGGTKAQGLAEAVNNLIESLSLMSIRQREVRHYFDVAVLGYSGSTVASMLQGSTVSNPILSITRASELGQKQTIRQGDITVERLVWVTAKANGQTPMCQAISAAASVTKDWAASHQDSFPPIVINISDGAMTDGDPFEPAGKLAQVQTKHGSALFFNCHISGPQDKPPGSNGPASAPAGNTPSSPSTPGGHSATILFPDETTPLPSRYAQDLFEMSSVLPDSFRQRALDLEFDVKPGARGFMYNATSADLVRFLNVGTPPAARN